MGNNMTESTKLYDLARGHIDALPAGAQSAARAKLEVLEAMTARTDAAYARASETAQRQAAAKPVADAMLKNAMQPKIFGMKATTAIVGVVAVGGLAIAAIKLTQGHQQKTRQGQWATRISQERALENSQAHQR